MKLLYMIQLFVIKLSVISKGSFFTLFISLVLLSTGSYAEVRYVDDNVKIPLRSGATTQHRIINFLSSGTKVTIKDSVAADSKWAEVTLSSGSKGWVQLQYLKTTPAAKQLLEISRTELAKQKEKNKQHSKTISELKTELSELKKQLDGLSEHSTGTDKELAHIKEISKNAVRLDRSNNDLLKENELLKASNEDALQQVSKLENKQQNQGILYGVLAVLLGIILGWIMPKMRSRQSDAWV